jgi:integrase
MAIKKASLTDAKCRSARADGTRTTRHYDGGGLHLEARPNGSRLWRLKYRFLKKEKLLALGSYPDTTLAAARAAATEARRLVAQGIDPAAKRQIDKQLKVLAAGNTFEAVGREWHDKFGPGWAQSHADKVLLRLEKNVFPWIGSRPITELEPLELLAVLRRIEHRGALDTARRVRQYLSSIFRYGIATGRAQRDAAADLIGAIPTPEKHSYAAITDPKEFGKLLRAIDAYEGDLTTRAALALAPMLFCRPGELRGMKWSEVDLEAGEWRLPPERQKLKKAAKRSNRTGVHIVPLATQAIALLQELKPLTEKTGFVFPSQRDRKRSMSDGTVNAALRRLGFDKTQITGHGFRHTASTMLNEQGWSPDAIECQLSHQDADVVRGIYNRAKYLPERRRMMQAWADRLDDLRSCSDSTPRCDVDTASAVAGCH